MEEEKEELGPPHVYVFGGLLLGLAKKGDLVGGKNKDKIQQAAKHWEEASNIERCELVKIAKIEKCYKQEHARVVLCFAGHPARKEIIDGLVQTGAIWKQGRPPKGAMERSLENSLEELLS